MNATAVQRTIENLTSEVEFHAKMTKRHRNKLRAKKAEITRLRALLMTANVDLRTIGEAEEEGHGQDSDHAIHD